MNAHQKTALIVLSNAIVCAAALRPAPALAGGPSVTLSPASVDANAIFSSDYGTIPPSGDNDSETITEFGGVNVKGPQSAAAAQIGGGPDPAATASALAEPGFYNVGSANAGVSYEFYVNGPSGADVPVDVSANLQVSISGKIGVLFSGNGAAATAEFYVGSYGYESCNLSCNNISVSGQSGPSSLDDPISQQFLVPTDTAISVFLLASAALEANTGIVQKLIGPGFASATADPTFEIDPGFAHAADYNLVFSPGLDASPGLPVPEARTWVMIALGFAGLSLARLRAARKAPGRRRGPTAQLSVR
jgi:hypothetical protein